jgi:hypothetical protein
MEVGEVRSVAPLSGEDGPSKEGWREGLEARDEGVEGSDRKLNDGFTPPSGKTWIEG